MQWYSSRNYSLILCACCLIASIEAAASCGQEYKIPLWEPDDSEPPGILRLSLLPSGTELGARIDNRTENFDLTLFANPFITDGKCPNIDSNFAQLWKFRLPHNINVDDDKGNTTRTYYFAKAFTGCYYAEMTNAEGRKWIWLPKFFKTNYHYYDTMLKCEASEFHPGNNKTKQLRYVLEIPQTCLKLKCELFELNEVDNDTVEHLNSKEIPASQTCWVINNNNESANSTCERVDSGLMLQPNLFEPKNEGWKVIMTWNSSKNGRAHYYAKFSVWNHTCKVERGDLTTWIPAVPFGALSYGPLDASNTAESVPPKFFYSKEFTNILYILLALVIAAILIFWMFKLAKLRLSKKQETSQLFEKNHEIIKLYDPMESDDILLIYARNSSDNDFIKTMEALRERLQHTCNVTVHDVYSDDNWNIVAKLGANEWVEDVLKAGCKVVWVDTPYFRSVVKMNESEQGIESYHSLGDCRDRVIPYAYSIATDIFQNTRTQYCRHFVVRLEELKVDDGPNDPLLVVSPHVRYLIPEHLTRLCEDLVKKSTSNSQSDLDSTRSPLKIFSQSSRCFTQSPLPSVTVHQMDHDELFRSI